MAIPELQHSQFQSSDGNGRYSFGYAYPEQVHMESRGEDGQVRGAYFYKDPNGNPNEVIYHHYWQFVMMSSNITFSCSIDIKTYRERDCYVFNWKLQRGNITFQFTINLIIIVILTSVTTTEGQQTKANVSSVISKVERERECASSRFLFRCRKWMTNAIVERGNLTY